MIPRRRDLAGPTDNGGGPAKHPFRFHPELPASHGICGVCQLPRANSAHHNLPEPTPDYTDPEAHRD